MAGESSKGTRVIALVGPAGAGKTSLAEAMLFAAGATDRLGSTANGSSIGDSSPKARQRGGSTELNLYNFDYLGDQFAILDCPGSIGFAADGARALAIADVAIVVVDPDPARAPLAAPALRALDELGIPHLIFVNRIDQAHGRIRDLLSALQPMSVSPLIARQIPIWDGEKVSGFVDLALERAFKYRAGNKSERIEIPADLQEREIEARTHMLEQLADHDDELLEQLLMDEVPSREKMFQDLARETGESLGVSVLFGSASSSWGVRRLLKALRHEAPGAAGAPPTASASPTRRSTCSRSSTARSAGWRCRACSAGTSPKARTSRPRTASMPASARCSRSRAKRPRRSAKRATATWSRSPRSTRVKAGQWLGAGKLPPPVEIDYPARNCAIAIEPADRKDDVKLSGALQRLSEEDAALIVEHDDANHEIRLRGVNDEHLNTVIARLKRRYGVEVKSHAPIVGYRESIRKPVTQKGRHKKQSGGHGQFGDVIIEVKPLPRGAGFLFEEKIHGGSVPKQWIPGGRGRRARSDAQRPARLPGGRLRGHPDRRQLSQRRQLRAGVPPRRPDRDAGSARRGPAASARADAQDHRRLPVERDQPDHLGGRRPARTDARHGPARRLDRLGPDRGADPGSRAVGPRGRAALAKPGSRDLRGASSTIWPSSTARSPTRSSSSGCRNRRSMTSLRGCGGTMRTRIASPRSHDATSAA